MIRSSRSSPCSFTSISRRWRRGLCLAAVGLLTSACAGLGAPETDAPQAAAPATAPLAEEGGYNPFDAEALRRAALARARQGDYSVALRLLARAFQLEQDSPANLDSLRRLYAQLAARGAVDPPAMPLEEREVAHPLRPWPLPGRATDRASPSDPAPKAPAAAPPASTLPPLWEAPRR